MRSGKRLRGVAVHLKRQTCCLATTGRYQATNTTGPKPGTVPARQAACRPVPVPNNPHLYQNPRPGQASNPSIAGTGDRSGAPAQQPASRYDRVWWVIKLRHASHGVKERSQCRAWDASWAGTQPDKSCPVHKHHPPWRQAAPAASAAPAAGQPASQQTHERTSREAGRLHQQHRAPRAGLGCLLVHQLAAVEGGGQVVGL